MPKIHCVKDRKYVNTSIEKLYMSMFFLVSFFSPHFFFNEPFNYPLILRVLFGGAFLVFILGCRSLKDDFFFTIAIWLFGLCACYAVISGQLPHRLIDFSCTFLCFFYIFRCRLPVSALAPFLTIFCSVYVIEVLLLWTEFLFFPYDLTGFTFSGNFTINTKTIFIVISMLSFFVFTYGSPRYYLAFFCIFGVIILATTERALILSYLIQLLFHFFGANHRFIKQHVKVNLVGLFLIFSSFCFWLLNDPIIDFSGTTFFDTLNIRLVFFAKAIIAIFSSWPIGLGVDGCLTAISALDIKPWVALVQEYVVFSPGQLRQLNFYAGALDGRVISTHNVFLGLVCDYGMIGLAFVISILSVFFASVAGIEGHSTIRVKFGILGLFSSVVIAYSLTPGLNEVHWLSLICGVFYGYRNSTFQKGQ